MRDTKRIIIPNSDPTKLHKRAERYKDVHLYGFPLLRQLKFDAVRSYNDLMERMLSEQLAKQGELVDSVSDAEHKEVLIDEYIEIRDNITFQFRKLLFIKAYTTFEASLAEFCKLSEPIRFNLHSYDDAKGKGIGKCKNFLKTVSVKNLPNPYWENIVEYNNVVNILKHQDGDFSDWRNPQTKKAIPYIKKHPKLGVIKQGEYLPSEKLLPEVIKNMEKIFEYVESEMEKAHPTIFNWY